MIKFYFIGCVHKQIPLKIQTPLPFGVQVGGLTDSAADMSSDESKYREFVKKIISKIKSAPGNDKCVDCGRSGIWSNPAKLLPYTHLYCLYQSQDFWALWKNSFKLAQAPASPMPRPFPNLSVLHPTFQ